jgi:hypothetical protein
MDFLRKSNSSNLLDALSIKLFDANFAYGDIMRDLNREACIWYLFTSPEFFEAAALECESIIKWEIEFAAKRKFSPNPEEIERFIKKADEFRHGAELATSGDYEAIWNVSRWFYSTVRGMIETSPDNWWMTEEQWRLFGAEGRLDRLKKIATLIGDALNNALTKANSFSKPERSERSDDDDGYPGDSIISSYEDLLHHYDASFYPKLFDPLPECVIDHSVSCRTGDEVPWTGVWYPETGLERHSLTFSIKGLKMQPVFRITKSVEELKRENPDEFFYQPETIAVATTWHPVIPSGPTVYAEPRERLKLNAPQRAVKPGRWLPTEPILVERTQEEKKKAVKPGTTFAFNIWRWLRNR